MGYSRHGLSKNANIPLWRRQLWGYNNGNSKNKPKVTLPKLKCMEKYYEEKAKEAKND